MKKYIETAGNLIAGQLPSHPDRARGLLNAAYSWVRLTAKNQHHGDIRDAAGAMNSALAGTIVDSFRKPQNSVMVNLFMPCELLHAMELQPMFPEGISTYLACTACQNIFAQEAEEHDVPESFCSYHKTMIGLAESGVMPAPLMIANTTLACDANQLSFRRLAELYRVPHTVIDVPYLVNAESIHYVADQLRTLSAQLEDISHRKLNPERLREAVARSNDTLQDYRKYLARRGRISVPSTMTGELCSLVATHVLLGSDSAKHYTHLLLEGLKKAAPKSSAKRIFWVHTLPNWQDSLLQIIDRSGNCEIVGTDLGCDWLGEMDPDRPYESMAQRITECICNGPATRRISIIMDLARQAGADGIIIFCHWGCKQTMGLSHMAKEMLEKEGFPTLVLDGDGCDSRNVSDGQMITRVNAFLEQLEG